MTVSLEKSPFRTLRHSVDLCVVGGGMAGVCAALAAARHGARVALMQDRPMLGGNASSEIGVHIIGADRVGHVPYTRETGLLEELRLDNTVRNPQKWLFRILQETRADGFPPCRNGVIEDNSFVFQRAQVREEINIGPHTAPETFRFARNRWYAQDRPQSSKPQLPTPEKDGTYGLKPPPAAPWAPPPGADPFAEPPPAARTTE